MSGSRYITVWNAVFAGKEGISHFNLGSERKTRFIVMAADAVWTILLRIITSASQIGWMQIALCAWTNSSLLETHLTLCAAAMPCTPNAREITWEQMWTVLLAASPSWTHFSMKRKWTRLFSSSQCPRSTETWTRGFCAMIASRRAKSSSTSTGWSALSAGHITRRR